MPLLEKRPPPMKPAQFAEQRIVEAILDRSYGPGDALPGERALSQSLGVTRPTIRETLQRLAREGWVTIAHGKPTRVNDYLSQGGLGLLSTLARYGHHLSHDLVSHLLQTRTLLLPGVAALAARRDAPGILAVLARAPGETEEMDPHGFARYDWGLQREMVILSGNPVVGMIFNDFEPVYQVMGEAYFSRAEARAASRAYYRDLSTALSGNPERVQVLVEEAMAFSQTLWEEAR